MQFKLGRLFVAMAILAATMALSRLIDSLVVAMIIGIPIAVIALIAKVEHVGPVLRTIISCAIGAGVVSQFSVGRNVLGHRDPEREVWHLVLAAVIVWFVIGAIDKASGNPSP